MLFDYFAGAIFTPQEAFSLYAIAFAVVSVVTGLAIFLGRELLRQDQGKKLGLSKSLLIGSVLVALIVLVFFVVPTMVRDSKWEGKQETCAKQVGYASSADDNSSIATAESQSAYRRCLGL